MVVECIGYWGPIVSDNQGGYVAPMIPCPKLLRDQGHHPHNILKLSYEPDWDKICVACLNTGLTTYGAIEAMEQHVNEALERRKGVKPANGRTHPFPRREW